MFFAYSLLLCHAASFSPLFGLFPITLFISFSLLGLFIFTAARHKSMKGRDEMVSLLCFFSSFLPPFLLLSYIDVITESFTVHRADASCFWWKRSFTRTLTATRRTFSHLSHIRRSGFLLPFFLLCLLFSALLYGSPPPFFSSFSIDLFVYLFIKMHQEFMSFCSFYPWKRKGRMIEMIPKFLL
jgi:hypothetical protein